MTSSSPPRKVVAAGAGSTSGNSNNRKRSPTTSRADDVPTFPEAAWRGPFADYRAAMVGTSEADDCLHFAALWLAAAARLGRRLSIHYAYPLYPNPYLVGVGVTGDAKKTSTLRQGSALLPLDRVKILRGVGSAEALAEWMTQSESGPQFAHVLLLEELRALLVRANWEGSSLLSFLTECFDTPTVYEAPFRKNPIKLVEPTPCLFAGTTAEWFWKSMPEDNFHGGFGNRLFFLAAGRQPPIPRPGRPDGAGLEKVRLAVDRLDALPASEVQWSPEAAVIWDEFYLRWKDSAASLDALTAAATKRIPAYALKLALLYAAFENTLPFITEDQMAAANLVAGFGAESAQWLVGQRRRPSAERECEEAVLRSLRREAMPTWKIHRAISGRFTAKELERTISALRATGAIVLTGTTSRRETIYGLRGQDDV